MKSNSWSSLCWSALTFSTSLCNSQIFSPLSISNLSQAFTCFQEYFFENYRSNIFEQWIRESAVYTYNGERGKTETKTQKKEKKKEKKRKRKRKKKKKLNSSWDPLQRPIRSQGLFKAVQLMQTPKHSLSLQS